MPPSISDTQSSSDVIVRENANVSLACAASGSPDPVVKWKRDDNSTINVNKTLAGKQKRNGERAVRNPGYASSAGSVYTLDKKNKLMLVFFVKLLKPFLTENVFEKEKR